MSRQDTLGRHATTIAVEQGITRVTYHKTVVVSFNADHIRLDSGGWRTVTTKTRMNQASRQFELGFSVFQKDFEWFVDIGDGIVVKFHDGLQLHRQCGQLITAEKA